MGNSSSGVRTMKAVVKHGAIGATGMTLEEGVAIPGLASCSSSSSADGADGSGATSSASNSGLKPSNVLVRVHASAINPVDYKMGTLIAGKVVGYDFSGCVRACACTRPRCC